MRPIDRKGRRRPGEDQEPAAPVPGSASVLVAMSGGVDSSVAALLLVQQGLHVQGLTFDLGLDRQGPRHGAFSCAPAAAVERAQQVCRLLDIPHQVIDRAKTFREIVIDPFCSQYAAGWTPNPCVRCNAFVKWPTLLEVASTIGCSHVATGHYARIQQSGDRFRILRGQDRGKDQSYALYALSQESLCRTLLPLGPMTKADIRGIAAEASLPTSDTRESQDICFIPEGDYRSFLASRLSSVRPGPIQDREGKVLGLHRGLPYYTVGQRKGLGVSACEPLYVIEKNAANNLLVVGPRANLCKETVCTAEVNWVSTPPPPEGATLQADVEVRYRSRPIPAELQVRSADAVHIRLTGHDQAVAPGQSAVWYEGDLLLGGGIIQEAGIRDQSL